MLWDVQKLQKTSIWKELCIRYSLKSLQPVPVKRACANRNTESRNQQTNKSAPCTFLCACIPWGFLPVVCEHRCSSCSNANRDPSLGQSWRVRCSRAALVTCRSTREHRPWHPLRSTAFSPCKTTFKASGSRLGLHSKNNQTDKHQSAKP